MQRIPFIDSKNQPAVSDAYNRIQGALGAVPNMFKVTAHSPVVLNAMWAGFGVAASGKIAKSLIEKISVAVSNANRCEYCLAAHTVLGIGAGATKEEMADAQLGKGKDSRETAAIRFGLQLLKDRGHVADTEYESASRHFTSEELVEIIHATSLTWFTNVINNTLKTPSDFPAVPLRAL